jgi:hypothetical protein
MKDENGNLLADSHNILNRWKNYFSQLLNVHNVSDVRLIEVQRVLLEGSPEKCWFSSACHTCMKCGCYRRCCKCPPVCSMYT